MKREFIRKLYQQYRLIIFPIITALSSLILIVLVIFPQTISLLSSFKTEGELRTKSQFLEAKAQSLESFNAGDLQQKLQVALRAYPTDKDFASTASLMQSLASKYGFVLINFQIVGSGSQRNKSQSYGIKLEALGPRPLLSSFINSLENSSRIMRVSSIELTSKQGGSINAVLGIDVFYSALPSTYGNVDSPLPTLSNKDQEVIASLTRLPAASTATFSAVPTTTGRADPFQ